MWIAALILLAVVLSSSGKAPSTPTTPTEPARPDTPPNNKPTADKPVVPAPVIPTAVPKTLSEYFTGDTEWSVAGWYTYADRWIRVDEDLRAKKIESTALGTVVTKVWYDGRFRWTVMMVDGATPLAIETTSESGTSYSVGFHNPEALTEEARNDAIDGAARAASDWIDIATGKADD